MQGELDLWVRKWCNFQVRWSKAQGKEIRMSTRSGAVWVKGRLPDTGWWGREPCAVWGDEVS